MQLIDLPVEIHLSIARLLHARDFISLMCISRHLQNVLDRELFRRATVCITSPLHFRRPRSVLHLAAHHDSVNLAEIALDKGIPISQDDPFKRSALCVAASSGSVKVARFLIEHGAEITPSNPKTESPVFSAAKAHEAAVLQLLIDAGGDVSKPCECDRFNQTPLLVALSSDISLFHPSRKLNDTICTLLRAGVDPQVGKPFSPLAKALERPTHDLDVVKLLLGAGARLQDEELDYNLKRVMERSHMPTVKTLVDSGTNIGRMFTHALRAAEPRIVRYLMGVYPEFEESDEIKSRALEVAVRHGRVGTARALISAGAKAEAVFNENGKRVSLVRLATEVSSMEMVKLLLASGFECEPNLCREVIIGGLPKRRKIRH
ncbi:hypothetical protein EMPG_15620 [Blastomyces silverae]|uniref:F-box domain-containing protein n=1 Tax=Blastomyces silverae TaxID=2060906 RepID=A0A0H1BC78_9EURO|nr:hypothetical protein EMPG_15620 [Blastomyces silverae]